MRLARRDGWPARASFVALCASALVIFAGAKLFYLVEHQVFPLDDPVPAGQGTIGLLLWHGFRLPGGLLLLALALPVVCRAVGLPPLRFADTLLPAVGVAIVCIRLGCVLNGCCFGAVTRSPLAVTFAPGTRVYGWQVLAGLIAPEATRSLPVHPLQLYFAAAGLGMFLLGLNRRRTAWVTGAVCLGCYTLFFGGTFLLELLRAKPLHLNLLVTPVVALSAAAILRVRTRAPVPA
jgi:phosphatidylglycerol:prolipoprotein diacylglycerol transferase